MEFREVLASRRSVKKYDPNHAISDAELKQLFDMVALSPSSFNLQHWRFVVVREPKHKAAVRKAAFGQEQVEACSAAIVVAGKLGAHADAEHIFAEAPEAVRNSMVPMINQFYEGKPTFQRDEAIRSGALAAMTLMMAACDLGYATGPMIGFDPQQVSEVVGLDHGYVPVMLIVLGKQVGELRPRAYRHPTSEFVKLESMSGSGLD